MQLAELFNHPRPDHTTWAEIQRLIADADNVDVPKLKQALAKWPRELPRPPLPTWPKSRTHLLSLCCDFNETAVYPLYTTAIGTSPLLRLSDGTQAATVWRQQRGSVELANGKRMAMNEDQPGMGDLGVALRVELDKPDKCCGSLRHGVSFNIVDGKAINTRYYCEECDKEVKSRLTIELYCEVEVKLSGKIPPGAVEYTNTSTRKLTQTERDQVQRQQARKRRGGVYVFADSCVGAVEALVKAREEITSRLQ